MATKNISKILNNLPICNITFSSSSDEEYQKAFYTAIRSNKVELVRKLIDKFFLSRPDELEEVLAKAYEELKLKNVSLSDEMEYFVEDKLINLRYTSNKYVDYKPSIDKIVERIDLVLEVIHSLITKYSKEVDQRFLLIARFIATNIYILKRQLKFTYNKLPWEEIEFCIVCFISSHINFQMINLIFNYVINKERLLYHLQNFAIKLEDEKYNIKSAEITKLSQLPNIERDKVVSNIIKNCPYFESLYKDYNHIRDAFSLQKIKEYIDMSSSANVSKKEGEIVITRTLQVVGEHLKNTLESPKLSRVVSDYLIITAPESIREILIKLRNTLSHNYVISNNTSTIFYTNLQNDLKKINIVINDIIYNITIKIVKELLQEIVNNEGVLEIKSFHETCRNISWSEITMESTIPNYINEYQKIKDITNNLIENIPEKTDFENELLKQILQILNLKKNETDDWLDNIEPNFLQGMYLLKSIYDTIDILENFHFIHRIRKDYATHALDNINECHVKENSLRKVGKLAFEVLESIKHRSKVDYTSAALRSLYNLLYISQYDTGNINEIEKLSNLILNGRKSKSLLMNLDAKRYQDELLSNNNNSKDEEERLMKILKKYRINQEDSLIGLLTYKNEFKVQAAIEMLLLDKMSFLEKSDEFLSDNLFFFDEYSPLLNGKIFRNNLAHSNAVMDVILFNPVNALLSHANIFLHFNKLKNRKTFGKVIGEDVSKVRDKFYQCQKTFDIQKNMFAALERGNLEDMKKCLEMGADINARDLDMRTALHYAAKAPNIEVVKFILEHIQYVEFCDRYGKTPLHIAATNKNASIEYLITERDFDVNAKDNKGKTPLHIAAIYGFKNTFKVLLKYGANIHVRDASGCTSMAYAVLYRNKNIIKILLENGVNVNSEILEEGTPLHLASENGDLELVNFLLQNKASVNASDNLFTIPLHSAALRGHVEIVKVLLFNGSNINTRRFDGSTALHFAVENGCEEVVKILLQHKANVNRINKITTTPLHLAVQCGHNNIIEILLRNGANINIATNQGFTALHAAAEKGFTDIVSLLLRFNADMDAVNNMGETALHVSAMHNHKNIIEILINSGAKINMKENIGFTPLHVSCFKGNLQVVKTLIEKGANVNAVDSNGSTPIFYGALYNHSEIVKYLINNKANINQKDSINMTPLCYSALNGYSDILNFPNINIPYKNESLTNPKLNDIHNAEISEDLINAGAVIDIEDENKWTPLHMAAFCGNIAIVEVLLKNGANINCKDINFLTPLHYAACCNHLNVIEILIENKATLNTTSKMGCSPLCDAVNHKFLNIVEILIKNEADVNVENGHPLKIAVSDGCRNIVKMLLKHSNMNDETLNFSLYIAAERGYTNIVKDLVNIGADVNGILIPNSTPVMLAVQEGHYDIIKFLIEKGSDVNFVSLEGYTLLHMAVFIGKMDVVNLLLYHNANINSVDCKERTPIVLAVAKGHIEIVKILLCNENININLENRNNMTLMHTAAFTGRLDIIKHLAANNMNINAVNVFGLKPIHIAIQGGYKDIVNYLLNEGCNISDRDARGRTYLHYAVDKGDLDIIQLLLDKNVDVNSIDDNGFSSVNYAVIFGFKEITELILNNGGNFNTDTFRNIMKTFRTSSEVFDIIVRTEKMFLPVKSNQILNINSLIKETIFINLKDSENLTLLHHASCKGYETIVEILLKNKANPNVIDKYGNTPLHYASKNGYLETVKPLLSHGAIFEFENDDGKTPFTLTDNVAIKRMFNFLNDCFIYVQNGDITVIQKLKRTNDQTRHILSNARNKDKNYLVIIAIRNDFPETEQLKRIFENDYDKVNLAENLLMEGRCQEALEEFKKILEKRKERLGKDNPSTLNMQVAFTKCLLQLNGNYEECLSIFENVYKMQRKMLGLNKRDTLYTRYNIAFTLHGLEKNQESLDILNEIYLEQVKILKTSCPDLLETRMFTSLVLNKLGKYKKALNLGYEILKNKKEELGKNHLTTLCCYTNVAFILTEQGKYKEALEIHRNLYALHKLEFGPECPSTLRYFYSLSVDLFHMKMYDEALQNFQYILAIQEKTLGSCHRDTLATSIRVGNLFFYQCKFIKALKAYTNNLDKVKSVFGEKHEMVREIEKKMKFLYFRLKLRGYDMSLISEILKSGIHIATSNGNIIKVEKYIKKGIDVNIEDNEERTPLHFAVYNGDINIIYLLLKYKADVTKITKKGNTLLHLATLKGHKEIVELLLRHVSQTSPSKLNYFVNYKTILGGTTALHVATKNGFIDIVKCLLEFGAIYDIKDNKNKKSIHYAIHSSIINILELTEEAFECAEKGNTNILKTLQERKSDIGSILNARNGQEKTIIQVAIANNQRCLGESLIKLLQDYNASAST